MVFSLKNQQKGFSPVRAGASRIVSVSDEFEVLSAYTKDLFSGQPVFQASDGYVRELSAANDLVLGVFNGVWYVDSQGDTIFRPYWPNTTAIQTGSVIKASVFNDPAGLFQIGSSTDTVFADSDKYVDLTPTEGRTGSTVTGRSSAQVSLTNKNAAIQATNVVRIRERSQQPGDVRLLIVSFIRPQFAGQIGG